MTKTINYNHMKPTKIKLLIIEDEEYDVMRIKNTLKLLEDKIEIIEIFSTGLDAINFLEKYKNKCDVIILDYQISGGLYGKDLIKEIKMIDNSLQIIIITKMTINQSEPEFANDLISDGAFWFGTKNPMDIEDFIYQPTDFILAIMNGYNKRLLELEKNSLEKKHKNSQKKLEDNLQDQMKNWQIIGQSSAFQNILNLIEKYAPIDANILITGESGTGKELIARNIHFKSRRKLEKLVTVNCSAIPFDLIESELFGYEKGAFTDAKNEKIGLFEQAEGGTLFLDEVSELPLKAQSKLLRVLETGEIDKIGRKHDIFVNVRIIAATNKDLTKEINENKFREDIFYRLNILNIHIPSLKERKSDINLLLDYYLKRYLNKFELGEIDFTPEARNYLLNYKWPGNVRQLKNVIQRMVLLADRSIDLDIVEMSLGVNTVFNKFKITLQTDDKIATLKEAEFEFRKKYTQFIRNKTSTDAEASKLLGIAPPNYYRLCKELGLK
ncbi:transcriptional regulatory protein ZraR [bacterium BMS3Abin03]|nr:transcriptional regulatory protein ZraR [bacterium BMS3Abin03]